MSTSLKFSTLLLTIAGTLSLSAVAAEDFDRNIHFGEGDVIGDATNGEVVFNPIKPSFVPRESKTQIMATYLIHQQMNDVRKRLGDIRAAQESLGVWARYNGGQLTGETGFDADFHSIQIGADTLLNPNGPRLGVALSYTRSEADDRFASADTDAYAFTGYSLWTRENGGFVDTILRIGRADSDLDEVGTQSQLENWFWSVSAELGQRATFGHYFFVEPTAELVYTRFEDDQFANHEVTRDLDAVDSLISRFGITLGKSCPEGWGNFYLRVGLLHEYMGEAALHSTITTTRRNALVERSVTVSSDAMKDGQDTWIEYAIGGDIRFNKNTLFFVDLERTGGADINEDWRANLGLHYSF